MPLPCNDPSRFCKATVKRTGKKCTRMAMKGQTVCMVHGGKAPQNIEKARQRLAELANPAVRKLGKLIEHSNGSVALGAVNSALDRNGFKPANKHELTGAEGGPIQITISSVESEL